jgi:ATP-dependent protease ClpP protease subunit
VESGAAMMRKKLPVGAKALLFAKGLAGPARGVQSLIDRKKASNIASRLRFFWSWSTEHRRYFLPILFSFAVSYGASAADFYGYVYVNDRNKIELNGRMILSPLIQLIIELQGPITNGDVAKFKQTYAKYKDEVTKIANRSKRLSYTKHNVIYLNSGGGDISAALELVSAIKELEVAGPTMVAVKGTCASACTLILFSAETRFARLCDKIGVHRASTSGGEEGKEGFEASTQIADYLMKHEVPWEVVKKMLLTASSDTEWLTPSDLRLANLGLLPGKCD